MHKRSIITLAGTAAGLLLTAAPVAADTTFGTVRPCAATMTTTFGPQTAPSGSLVDIIGAESLLNSLVGEALLHNPSHRDVAAAEESLQALMAGDSALCACDGSMASTSVFDTTAADGFSGSMTTTCARSSGGSTGDASATATATSTHNAPTSLLGRIGLGSLLGGLLG
ncbi:hypothetical protein [Nonomuraea rhizosphaerae]|uniref:hypothetical protein n=1 Tax=Nonomuraea rhizosphaerae TaxID=2665663 RepID=UPI001C5CF22D|nr:hypothetical protein [Nonomuraea rhizosphaerae]